ncbi:hypothetical protein AWW66_07265 [Micromonospora rosaria]|uniref:Tight adherence protein B n=1 Tax=Micromonospora rosaria TaxID=47874 RepID=A0A136PVU9_9ACTN|nr:hypothetical protein [Micromonospora rosaria]KXK62599.1 hypothetical protein AWW66_07265 [Micromonospora rosaria]
MTIPVWLVAGTVLAAVLLTWPVRLAWSGRRAGHPSVDPARRPAARRVGRLVRWARRDNVPDPLVNWVAELRRIPDTHLDPPAPARPDPAGVTGTPASARSTAAAGPARPHGGAGPVRPPGRHDPRRPRTDGRPPVVGLLRGGPSAAEPGNVAGRRPPGDDVPIGAPPTGRPQWPAGAGRARADSRSGQPQPSSGTGWAAWAGRWGATLAGSPRRTLLLTGLTGAVVGGALAGPVAAVALAGYGLLGARALVRRRAARQADRARRRRLDQLCGLAADLRAGLPAPVASLPDATGAAGGDADRVDRLTTAAVHLAERTGAPLAELLERIEADTRLGDRGLAAAAAQAAGARATAWLLAALPLGGIGLGYGIGVDPVAILLHTPVGAACTLLTVALQAIGLIWADKLTAMPGRAA